MLLVSPMSAVSPLLCILVKTAAVDEIEAKEKRQWVALFKAFDFKFYYKQKFIHLFRFLIKNKFFKFNFFCKLNLIVLVVILYACSGVPRILIACSKSPQPPICQQQEQHKIYGDRLSWMNNENIKVWFNAAHSSNNHYYYYHYYYCEQKAREFFCVFFLFNFFLLVFNLIILVK